MEKFKFFNEGDAADNFIYLNEHAGFLQVVPNVNNVNVDFYFQFDEEEPVRFANGDTVMNIRINPEENANIIFNDNGRVFKIFAKRNDD